MNHFTSKDYNFPMKISEQCYESKPTSEQISQMKFSPTTVTCTTLADCIQTGHAYCPTERKLNEVKECYAICIDVDDSTVPMDSYVANLTDTPSLYYTTPSNGDVQKSMEKYGDENHIYRFRLVYVLATPTLDIDDFDRAYHYITSTNHMYNVDVRKANQYYNGSYGCSITNTNYIYQLPYEYKDSIVEGSDKDTTLVAGSSQILNILSNNTVYDDPAKNSISKEFLRDLRSIPTANFIAKYRFKYDLFNSNIDDYQATNGYHLLDDGYIELKRRWIMEQVHTPTGCTKKFRPQIRKDGQHRRLTLYNTARLFLKMKDITLEHLILLMVNERHYYYDNSDGVLTNQWLVQMCKDVFNTKNIDQMNVPENDKSFKVDKPYWESRSITVRQAVPMIRKELNYKRIDALYDPSMNLTNKEWVEYLSDNGIKISESTFKRYKREKGFTTLTHKNPQENP